MFWRKGKSKENQQNQSDNIHNDSQFITGEVNPYGIHNLGATCFMNSALQCILSLPCFISKLDELINESKDSSLLVAFKRFIYSHDPKSVKNLVARKNHIFYGYYQQDSFEFAITFIESILCENNKGVSKLFIGNSESILQCTHCMHEMPVSQTYSSINLSTYDTRRVNYVPFLLTKPIILMSQIPTESKTVTASHGYHSKSIQIGQSISVAKMSHKIEFIDQISPEYPNIYSFEVPERIQDGCGFVIIQLKTANKRPISSPFLCEVPLQKTVTEDEMKDFLIERLKTVIMNEYDDEKDIKESISFTKPLPQFTFSEKPPICSEYVNVVLSDEHLVSFDKRQILNDKGPLCLDQLFNSHIRQSQLEPGFTWECEKCKERSRIYKRTKYTKLPRILLFQMKRSSGYGDDSMPDDVDVSLPLSISVDITGKFDRIVMDPENNENGPIYELRSISQHGGSFGGGHYWAYGKRGSGWYCFDDFSVSSLSNPNSPSRSAYFAFYELISGQINEDEENDEKDGDHELGNEEEKDGDHELGNEEENKNSNEKYDDKDK